MQLGRGCTALAIPGKIGWTIKFSNQTPYSFRLPYLATSSHIRTSQGYPAAGLTLFSRPSCTRFSNLAGNVGFLLGRDTNATLSPQLSRKKNALACSGEAGRQLLCLATVATRRRHRGCIWTTAEKTPVIYQFPTSLRIRQTPHVPYAGLGAVQG